MPLLFSLSKNPCLKQRLFVLQGEYEGAGAPLVLTQMPAKSLRRQAFAPHSGSISNCVAI